MKLKVIGYWGGYPASDKASSAYLLEKDGYRLMLDFGSGALAKLQKYIDLMTIDAVILSHYHADHIADIGVLQHALLVKHYITDTDTTVPIYGHRDDTAQFGYLEDDFTKAVAYDPEKTLKLGPFFIRFLKTKHSVACYGMRITDGESTIVYTADSAYQDEWLKFSKDADLLLADTNFYAGMDAAKAGHMTSEEVATIANEASVKELILTHLPHFGDHATLKEEAKKIYSGPIRLADEGLIWQKKGKK